MANANFVTGYYGGTGRNKILSQTLATGTETEFQLGNDASASQIAVVSMPVQTAILGSQSGSDLSVNPATLNAAFNRIGYFGDSNPPYNAQVFDSSHPFLLRVCGVITPASNAGNTFQLKAYLGATKAGTNICATGAITGFESSTTPGGFILEAQLIWDSTSGVLAGQYWWNINAPTPSYNTWKALSVASAAAVSNLTFCASAQWGNAAGGVVAVSEFTISQL
jgi:hypothetical protein